ncbi:MAG: hypothetical protein OXB95_08985, partial [Rhodobacteraceae bacterium]|nr:hypothetical protein [Paracoccaceae bacterium]
ECRKLHSQRQLEVSRKQRIIDQVPHAQRLQDIRRELEPLAALKSPPFGWRNQLESISRRSSRNQARSAQAQREVKRLEHEREVITEDTVALGIVGSVKDTATTKSAYDEAVKDLPRRRDQADMLNTDIAILADRLGIQTTDVDSYLPTAGVLSDIRSLIEKHAEVKTRHDTQVESVKRADERLNRLSTPTAQIKVDSSKVHVVDNFVTSVIRSNPRQRLQTALEYLEDVRGDFKRRLDALQPWRGDILKLIDLDVPRVAVVEAWKAELEQLAKRRDQFDSELKSLHKQLLDIERKRSELDTVSQVSLAEIAEIRQVREHRWAEHLEDLAVESAMAFETAMRTDDALEERRIREYLTEEKAKELNRSLSDLQSQISRQQSIRGEADREVGQVQSKVTELGRLLFGPAGDDLDCGDLSAWLNSREVTIQVWRDVEVREARVRAAEQEVDRMRSNLAQSLENCGKTVSQADSLEALLAVARDFVSRFREAEQIRDQHRERVNELKQAKSVLAQSESALSAWKERWADACSQTKFARDGTPTVAFMRGIVDTLDKLDRRRDEHRSLIDRIEKMTANRDRFLQTVREFARRLELGQGKPQEQWRQITARVEQAVSDKTRLEQITREHRQRNAEVDQLGDELIALEAEIAELGKPYGETELEVIRERLTAADRANELRKRESALLASIRSALGSQLGERELKDLHTLDISQLELDLIELNSEAKQASQDVETHLSQKKSIDDKIALIGGNRQVALLKERHANRMLEVREEAVEHLRQYIGALAVEQAIALYRDQHRSGMLAKAQQVFSTISGGAYTALGTVVSGNNLELNIRSPEGNTKSVNELSDGTRCQLYLALRIAGYYEVMQQLEPLPFVADDILESFDDDRAARTFEVLEEMSEVGQVVYLTHHAHLCDIAQRVCRNVTVHTL